MQKPSPSASALGFYDKLPLRAGDRRSGAIIARPSETATMNNARINGLRSIELGVHDLQKSAEFYRRVWALEDVAAEGDTIHMRGTGREHHVITLRERPRAASARGAFLGARPRHGGCAARQGQGAWAPRSARRPARCRASAGGGYGFRVSTPEGHPIVDLVRRRGAWRGDR